MDEDVVSRLCDKFVCREAQIQELFNLFSHPNEAFVDCVYLYGCTSTGKSSVVNSLLEFCHIPHVLVNLVECYTPKILFEKILKGLQNELEDSEDLWVKCDNLMDFIRNLRRVKPANGSSFVVVLDKAERLRDMDMNLLPAFLRFRELSGLPFSFILISELEFIKLVPKGDVSPPIEVYFPQYTKEELLDILVTDFLETEPLKNLMQEMKDPEKFYSGYLNAFLSVFYRVCRDLAELRYLAKQNFGAYCLPVTRGEVQEGDVVKLWRHIAPLLKVKLNYVYLRMNSIDSELLSTSHKPTDKLNENFKITSDKLLDKHIDYSKEREINMTDKTLAQTLELPFYAKYLLIAAYLASYNPAKEDKRLFMKNHGKRTKTKAHINAKSKVAEQTNIQLGPKPFNFDRLLAIFYAILEEKMGLNSNLLAQVSSLVQLQLLSVVGHNLNLDNQRYKCNVSFEFIQTVAKMVGFNIRKYLYDFI